MARLRNNRIQPVWFHYIGKNGRTKVLIESKGTVDVPDFIEPIESGQVENGWIEVISDLSVKMMEAEMNAMSYIKAENSEKQTK